MGEKENQEKLRQDAISYFNRSDANCSVLLENMRIHINLIGNEELTSTLIGQLKEIYDTVFSQVKANVEFAKTIYSGVIVQRYEEYWNHIKKEIDKKIEVLQAQERERFRTGK